MAPAADVYWLALRRVRGIGPRTARLLLERFGSAEKVFEASPSELGTAGIPQPTVNNIIGFNDFAPLEKELCELPKIGARLVRWTDHDYPVHLRQIGDPPPFLFMRGTLAPDEPRCVAVVGARAASEAGRRMAQRLGLELATKGFTVVSGLARGIDTEAHQGSLDGSGRTVAVLGCGVDVVYPAENRKLTESILEQGGAILSELPVGTPPIAENFPTRNRLISGMCLGVVIVEAAEKSGSLITARTALEQNRQVFAVPGSPLNGKTRGSNRLLKDGARLVDCVEDVLEELLPQLGGSSAQTSTSLAFAERPSDATKDKAIDQQPSDVKNILMLLGNAEKLHVDALIDGSGLNTQTVLRLLLELELGGLVTQHPGKLFSLA